METGIPEAIGSFRRCWLIIAAAVTLLIVAPWSVSAVGRESGWLGATLSTVTPTTRLPKGLSLTSGALVTSVQPNSPAANSGLRPGDVILSANDRKVATADDLLRYLESLGVGSTITMTRARAGGGRIQVSVVLGTKPGLVEPAPKTASPPQLPAPKLPATRSGPPDAPAPTTLSPTRPAPDRGASRARSLENPSTGSQPTAPSSIKSKVVPVPPTPPPTNGGYDRAAPPAGEGGMAAPSPATPTIGGYERAAPPAGAEGGMAAPSPAPFQRVPKNGEPTFKMKRFEYQAPAEAPPSAQPARVEEPYTTIKLFYATDRNKTNSKNPIMMYGADRGTLRYGTCDVTVPKDHRVGELEAPSYLRLEFSEDPAKHVILSRVTEQASSDFYKDVGSRVAASKGKSAFIFVHGYNVTFKDAARRTAQMSYDLKFDGAPVFFSWPSQGSYVGYAIDEANVEYARSDLKTFIVEFARNSTADQIYLVAHSMGNRALTGAIAELFREAPDVKVKIKEIILAAPDIDADVFKRDIAPAIIGPGQAITLYSSSNDLALKASKKFHGYARAGDSGQALTVVPGIATIDSSDVETDFLGHSYFAESTSIIADIFNILGGLTKPEQRTNLIAVNDQAGRYWKIRKAVQ